MKPWAVVPVKDTAHAKQRLAQAMTASDRQMLALNMFEDVLSALANARSLAGVLVVTVDPQAKELAGRIGARVIEEGARNGHTGAVNAGINSLIRAGVGAVLTLPIDVPLVTAEEIDQVVAAHAADRPTFTIVPAHDELGSNCILLSPPDSVPLRFGDDSFYPHLAAARRLGIQPTIAVLPGIGLDIDHPADLLAFMRIGETTKTAAFLKKLGRTGALTARDLRPSEPK